MPLSIARLAWRNLWRHKRRTQLLLAVVAYATVAIIFFWGFFDGFVDMMITSQARFLAAPVLVQSEAHLRDPDPENALAGLDFASDVAAVDGVRGVAARLQRDHLLAVADAHAQVARQTLVRPHQAADPARGSDHAQPQLHPGDVVQDRGSAERIGAEVGREAQEQVPQLAARPVVFEQVRETRPRPRPQAVAQPVAEQPRRARRRSVHEDRRGRLVQRAGLAQQRAVGPRLRVAQLGGGRVHVAVRVDDPAGGEAVSRRGIERRQRRRLATRVPERRLDHVAQRHHARTGVEAEPRGPQLAGLAAGRVAALDHRHVRSVQRQLDGRGHPGEAGSEHQRVDALGRAHRPRRGAYARPRQA